MSFVSRRGARRQTFAVGLLALAGWTAGFPLGASWESAPNSDPDSSASQFDVVEARDQRRRELDASVERLRDQLTRTEAQRGDLLGQAGAARARARLQREKLLRARLSLEVGEEAVVAGQREIETLEHDIEQSGQRLVRSARALYRFGRFAYIRLMFSLQEGAQPLPAFRQLRYLTQRDAASLALFRTAVAELKVQQAALAERQLELVGLVEAEREEASRLRREEQRLVALVERLEDRRRRIAAEVSTQETRSDRLGKLMETLAKEGPSGLNDDPIQQYRGGLDWPVEGRIATAFGSRRDPKYGTEVAHNGLELAVESPTSVRSVYPGRVIFAAPFQDLGFTVVLQHEDAVLTLYAGLEELLVAEGDVLALGDSVGSISDRLYFEIRQQRRPEDPVDWLR